MDIGAKILIKGRVQGVGFRWFVTQHAKKLEVNGYVKNLPNGDIAIEAEGKRGQLEELINYVKTGPRFSKVADLSVEWQDYTGEFSSFEITH